MKFPKPSPEQRARARLRRKELREQARRQQRESLRAMCFLYVALADGEVSDAELRHALSCGVQLNTSSGRSNQGRDTPCRTLRSIPLSLFTITARRALLRELKALCLCDGPLNTSEETALERIAKALQITRPSSKRAHSMAASHCNPERRKRRPTTAAPVEKIPWFYEFLGCLPTDSDQTIKAAYRQLAVRYHPDKHSASADKPEQLNAHIEEFQRLQLAYQEIQKTRVGKRNSQ